MKLKELWQRDSRLYVKSEFGPAGSHWPALSFSSRKIASDFMASFRRDHDFVIYVGTGHPVKTEDPAHRRRLLSVISVEPRAPIATDDIVPLESWEKAVNKWGERWQWSLPIVSCYDVIGFPLASDIAPQTYSSLGQLTSLGRCVGVKDEEIGNLLGLDLDPVTIEVSSRVKAILALNPSDKDLRDEMSRLAFGIQEDVKRAGKEHSGTYADRFAPNISELFQILNEKWDEQGGKCSLCGGPIPLKPKNRLLQMSRDRIDSSNKAYAADNIQITHLGCNLAKNDVTMDEWREYLEVVTSGCYPTTFDDNSVDSNELSLKTSR